MASFLVTVNTPRTTRCTHVIDYRESMQQCHELGKIAQMRPLRASENARI
jgi:hypothetical protein